MHFIDDFAQRAKNYLLQVNNNPVYPDNASLTDLNKLNTQLQHESLKTFEVIDLLDNIGSPATVKTTGGRYYVL